MNIKDTIVEKFEIVKNWVLENKLKASVIALVLLMAAFAPDWLFRIGSIIFIVYMAFILINKAKE